MTMETQKCGTEKMYETEKGEKQNVNFWLTLRTYQALSERGHWGVY